MALPAFLDRSRLVGDAVPGVPGTTSRALTWNPQTGAGTERDPLEWEYLRMWFMVPDKAQYEYVLRNSGIARALTTIRPEWYAAEGEESWTIQDKSAAAKPLQAHLQRLQMAHAFTDGQIAANELGNAATWIQVEERGVYQPGRQAYPIEQHAVTGIRDLVLITKDELVPCAWQQESGDPHIPLGAPLVFDVQLSRVGAGRTPKFKVHASRLLLWRGAPVRSSTVVPPSYGWGDDSVLLGALGALQSIGRVRRSIDRAADTYRMLVAYSTLPSVLAGEDQRASFEAVWANIAKMSSLGVFVADKGDGVFPSDRVEQLDAPLTGLVGLGPEAIRFLCMDSRLPLPVVTGEFVGAMGGEEGQLAVWYMDCRNKRAYSYGPQIRYVADLLYASAGIYTPEYTLSFAPIVPPDPLKKQQARLIALQGDRELVDMGALTPNQVHRSRVAEGYQDDLQPSIPGEEPTGKTSATPAAVQRDPVARATFEEPSPAVEPAAPAEPVADLALNGAQIEALLAILERVASGQLSQQGAITTITVALPIVSVAKAQAIVAGVNVGQAGVIDSDPAAIWIGLEVDPAAMRPLWAALPPSVRRDTWAHLTLCYPGVVRPKALPDVLAAVASLVHLAPVAVEPVEVGELGDEGAQVVFVRRQNLRDLESRLLRAVAPAITAEQFPRFIPHVTLGYGEGEVRAVELPASLPILAVVVKRGEVEIGRFPVGAH